MRRLGDVLSEVAGTLGVDGELRLARQMSTWQRLVAELVPRAAGATSLLSVQPPTLVVSASTPIVAQELQLRQVELLTAFAGSPEGLHLLDLRVVLRPPVDRQGRSPGQLPG